ncbi:hypothetical protein [Streptomyces sp. NBC_00353]|uniref:hypothetical protein n=1 Tax=Streptomyces sp. NBC_00353 TaxID=2975722 RepID=UPI003FA745DA
MSRIGGVRASSCGMTATLMAYRACHIRHVTSGTSHRPPRTRRSARRRRGAARDEAGGGVLESGCAALRDQRHELVARLGEVRTVEFYEEDTRLALPPACYDVRVTRSDGDASAYRVELTARTLLRDLALFPDRLDPAAAVDEMLVTLLPGESAVFRVTGAVIEDPGALGTRPVLRCVNDTIA